jgi:hypothetical protein
MALPPLFRSRRFLGSGIALALVGLLALGIYARLAASEETEGGDAPAIDVSAHETFGTGMAIPVEGAAASATR